MSGLAERIARDATLDVWKPGPGLMISSAVAMYLAEACARAAVHAALDEAAKVAREYPERDGLLRYRAETHICEEVAAAIETLK